MGDFSELERRAEMGLRAEVGKHLCPRSDNGLCILETEEDRSVGQSCRSLSKHKFCIREYGRRGSEADGL